MDYFHYLDNVAGYDLFQDGDPIRCEGIDIVKHVAERKKDFERLKQLYHSWEEKIRRNRRGRPECHFSN